MVMKKLLLTLLVSTSFVNAWPKVTIVDYKPSDFSKVLRIALQDHYDLISGSNIYNKDYEDGMEDLKEENTKILEKEFNDSNNIIKLLIANDRIIGFVIFTSFKEKSIETYKQETGLELDPQQVEEALFMIPHIKRTEAECQSYAIIKAIAISRESRQQGYGHLLLQYTLKTIQEMYPDLHTVTLDVNESNTNAQKLFESEGFKPTQNQHFYSFLAQVLEYSKSI